MDQVEVTGSRMRLNSGEQPTQPVLTFTSADIERTGASDLGQLFQYIPAISSFNTGLGTDNVNSTTSSGLGSGQTQSRTTAQLRGGSETATLLLVDGKRVFAATGGRERRPAEPDIVFLHGAGMDHSVWTLQTRWFAHHGRNALAIDLPGHGRSEGPALASIEAMADFLPRLLDAAGAAQAALVGHFARHHETGRGAVILAAGIAGGDGGFRILLQADGFKLSQHFSG
jgi:hypothetical protein